MAKDLKRTSFMQCAITGRSLLNGAVAHLGKTGDILTIMSFGLFDPAEAGTHRPKVIILGEKNEVLRQK